MAFVVPVVAAFSAVSAAGGVVAAMSTLTGFLTVAGGVLAGVGALTGKKDLVKLGSFMSLGSNLVNALGQGAAEAGAGAAEEIAADSLTGAAGDVAGEAAGEAVAGVAADAAGSVPLVPGQLGGPAMDQFGQMAELPAAGAANAAGAAPAGPVSLADRAASSVPTTPGTLSQQFATDAVTSTPDALSQAGQSLTSNDIASWLERAKKGLGGVSDFVKNNKELVTVGGDMLASMYGPEAEQADLIRKQNQQQQAWMERARQNLNTPIALKYRTGGT